LTALVNEWSSSDVVALVLSGKDLPPRRLIVPNHVLSNPARTTPRCAFSSPSQVVVPPFLATQAGANCILADNRQPRGSVPPEVIFCFSYGSRRSPGEAFSLRPSSSLKVRYRRPDPLRADHFFCPFPRSNSSRLNGKFVHVTRSSAPPAAEKTDRSSGAFIPKAIVIVSAKLVRGIPLAKR
jgi:hypothetical protein